MSVAVFSLALLAGCGGLPEADGTEAAIAEKAQGLPPLAAGTRQDGVSAARSGLLRSPDVREAASLVAASADEVRVQRAALFPSLGLSLGGGTGDAGQGDAALELEGRQLLFDFGDTKRAISVADLDLQINYIAFHKAVDESLVDSLETYDRLRMYGELLQVYRAQLDAMRDLEGLIAARTESGAASSPDLLETRKRMQSAEFLVHDTELSLEEARDRLIRLTGMSQGGNINIPSSPCAPSGGSDEMLMAQLELAKAELTLERAERARQPRLSMSPIARSELEDKDVSLGLNLGVQSDLLQGGALTARANAARNTRQGAMAGVEAAALDDELDSRRLRRDIAAGNRKVEMLERQIELLTQTRELYRSQYFDLGTRQLTELLDNEEEFYNRQAELIELRSAMVSDRLACAERSRTLRRALDIEGSSLYGYPLISDEF